MRHGYWALVGLLLVLAGVGSAALLLAGDKPPADAGKKEAAVDGRPLLEAVGMLATSNLYQAYLNIGFLADGKAEGTYDEKDAKQVLGSVLGLLDGVDKQLEKVGKLELTKEDREGLDQLRKLAALLREEGKELQALWETGDKEHGSKYEKLRQESWEAVSQLLGTKPAK